MLEHAFIMDSLILVLLSHRLTWKKNHRLLGHCRVTSVTFGPCRVTAVLDLASKMGNSW